MTASQLSRLFGRDKGICHYCLNYTTRKRNKSGKQQPWNATKEHIVPRSLGGPNVMSNYVLACAACNNRRGVTLFFCKCSTCHRKIHNFLSRQPVIDQMFWGMVGFNKPKILQDRDGMWRVRMPGTNVRFHTWQEALDYVLITHDFSNLTKKKED